MIKKFCIFILIVCAALIYAEEDSKTEEKSQNEERRETLKYGIDQEVLDLIKSIQENKITEFDSDFLMIFTESKNAKIKEAIIRYFLDMENPFAKDVVVTYLENYDLEQKTAILAYLDYVKHFKITEAGDAVSEMLTDSDTSLVSSAVTVLGALNSSDYFEDIWALYEDDDNDDNIKSAVIRALGESGDPAHLPFLIEILEDTDQRKAFRWYACEALGKIADPSSLDLFTTVWNENDPIMKTYILKALKSYQMDQVYAIYEEAMRNQSWKVRVEAIKALGDISYVKAIDIIIYKARKDPEMPVRKSAFQTIAEINTKKGFDFLRDFIKKNGNSESLKLYAITLLGEKDFKNSIITFVKIIDEEWEKDKSKLLDTVCKQFSLYKTTGQTDLFERMIHHKSLNLKLYALRAIGLNGISGLKAEVEKFTTEKTSNSIKKVALDVLKKIE